MRAHVYRFLRVAIATIVAALPAVATNDAVRAFIDHHPKVAATYPLVAGVVYALYRGYKTRNGKVRVS